MPVSRPRLLTTGAVIFLATGAGAAFAPASPGSSPAGELPRGEEIDELRTLTSRTYAREDGYFTVVALTPIHYVDARHRLRPIDLRLRPAKSGRHATRAAVQTTIERTPASVRVAAGSSAARVTLAGTRARPSFSRGGATYRGALRGTTLRYTPASRGVRVEVLLMNRRAPARFIFPLELSSGLIPRVRRGRVDVVDITGSRYFALRSATLTEGQGLPNARPGAVKLTGLRVRTGLALHVAVDRAWLRRPERRFPVTIDFGLGASRAAPPPSPAPAVTVSPDPTAGREPTPALPPAACLIASNQSAERSVCPSPRLAAGRWTEGRREVVARSLLRFDVSGISEIAEVDSASLVLGVADRRPEEGATDVSVHALQQPFTESATWRFYEPSKPWSTPGGDFSQVAPAVSGTWAGDELTFDLTALVRQWVANTAPNRGVLVKTADEGAASRWSFCGPDPDLSRCSAQLHVVHRDEEPPQEDSSEADAFLDREPVEPPDPPPSDCDNPDAPNEGPAPPELCGGPQLPTTLEMAVWPAGRGRGPASRRTLRCYPTGGTLPARSSACRKLLALQPPFPRVPAGAICLRAGNASVFARVRGRLRGRRVWVSLRRTDRCEIARWHRVAFLLRGH